MTDAQNFAKLVPGFDFLQGLVKNAGTALPGMGQWVAPTLDPAELDKRIGELRTVQFWLEQNARMLGATIQALEVQRMTLSTLSTMNVQMEDLRDALMIRTPGVGAKNDEPATAAKPAKKAAPKAAQGNDAAAPSPAAAVDPMQWWGALTQQFTELASNAMKEGSAGAAQQMAESMTKQGLDAVQKTMQAAAAGAAPAKPDKRKKASAAKR